MIRFAKFTCAALVATAFAAHAQNVISAKSGLIHYTEGSVTVDDKAVEPKKGQFAEMKNGDTLTTTEGRAEVLLGPGAFLRVGENSSVLMLDSRLTDTRIQIVSGTALIECVELLKGNNITVVAGAVPVQIRKAGLYRFDLTENAGATLKVFDGEATVGAAEKPLVAKKGKMVTLGGALVAMKFDPRGQDTLYRWAAMRSDSIALANASSARGMMDSRNAWRGGWFWNPWFNMYTYMPYRGIYYSPFGGAFFSPAGMWSYSTQPVYSGGGGNGNGNGGGGYYDSDRGYSVSGRSSDRGGYSSAPSSGGSVSTGSSGGASASSGRSGADTGGGRGDSNAGGRGR